LVAWFLGAALVAFADGCGRAGTGPRGDKTILNDVVQCLVDAKGEPLRGVDLSKKQFVLVYFSAHWCPPCRAFTPQLVAFYNARKRGDNFELVFVSADQGRAEMLEYMRSTSMPWPALEFGRPEAKRLAALPQGRGIPCLVLLDRQGAVLSDSFDGSEYRGPQAVLRDLEQKLPPAASPTAPGADAAPPAQAVQQTPPAQAAQSNVVALTDEQVKAQYKLKGLMSSPRERLALINGKFVGIGESIGKDATVKEIKNDPVVIQIGEKTYTLRQ
jgi:nucleoredoxin